MAKGVSIHVGLNRVDPDHYQGWDGALRGCENDAREMSAIADARGFNSTLILTKDATSRRIRRELQRAAGILRAGDLLLLTYSGYGSQVPDLNSDEGDRKDETWVLYDRQFIDDELYAAFGQLDAGVRTFVLSDSCHSGTVTREVAIGELVTRGAAIKDIADTTTLREFVDTESLRFRLMPPNKQDEVFGAHTGLYDKIQASVKSRDRADLTPIAIPAPMLEQARCPV